MASTVLQISAAEVRFGNVLADGSTDPSTLTSYACQVTKAEITSTTNTTTSTVPATFCSPASEVSVPVASSFQLDLEFLQDWTVAAGLSAYMFANDALTKGFALYLNGAVNPVAYGKVIVQSGGFGGVPGEPLIATVTLNIAGYPTILNAAGTPIRPIVATGATAGIPGVWKPTGAVVPADLAAVTAAGLVASPTTAWTVGQYVQTAVAGVGGRIYWNGTTWVTGAAP